MRISALWLRWSWRDLRARWVQVAAIALIIALGTGIYAGMSSVMVWRTLSNEASYAETNIYDLRVRLSTGSFVPTGTLTAALLELEHASWVEAAEERLLLPTQVDVDTQDEAVLVSGRIVGVDLEGGGPHVNSLHVDRGRSLVPDDAGQDVALLERAYATHYKLPEEGEIRIAGDRPLRYVGHALAPEYFLVVTEDGGVFAQANFAVVFTSLQTAQRLAGLPGQVNDLVVVLSPDADRAIVAGEIERRFGEFGAAVMETEDDPSYRMVTRDVEGDQQFYDIFAVAVFAGAVFAAFNLITRMVEAQRREIGIAMALGLSPRRVALRPLLVGAQIALLGVVFGIGIGMLVSQAVRAVLIDFFPLPVWETPFQPLTFARVAAIGFAAPFFAIAYPVWRAVRITPVDAIKTGNVAARSGGLAPLLKRIPLPGDSLSQMPIRNLARAPRRMMLTLLAIAAVIAVVIGVVGMIDTFIRTVDVGEEELLGTSPDRVVIDLDAILPIASPKLSAVLEASTISGAEPGLSVGGVLGRDDTEIEVFLHLIDLEGGLWRPTVTDGALDPGTPGVYIARKAARDLDVGVGDTIVVRHPQRQGPFAFTLEETELPVLGVHPDPFRFNTYLDLRHAGLMGLEGTANVVYAEPEPGATVAAVKRELFGLPGVTSVQRVAAGAQVMQELMGQFMAILRVVEVAILGLAMLIAFNSASIKMDERAREHATMFAFGVPVHTVMRTAVVESLAIGLMATAVGLAGGYVFLRWIVEVVLARTMPELGALTVISPASLALMGGLGVLAVAAAPLLTVRKLRRMDIPSTLRVME